MVSVVDVPILVHFPLEIHPSLEEQFLQCLVYAIFSLVLFSSYFSCVNVLPLFSENLFCIFKTSVAITADYLKKSTIRVDESGSNDEVSY